MTTAPYRHRIDTGDHPLIVVCNYQRLPKENQIIETLIQDMLLKNIIQPSDSS